MKRNCKVQEKLNNLKIDEERAISKSILRILWTETRKRIRYDWTIVSIEKEIDHDHHCMVEKTVIVYTK